MLSFVVVCRAFRGRGAEGGDGPGGAGGDRAQAQGSEPLIAPDWRHQ